MMTVLLFSFGVCAEISCHDGAINDSFGLFQTKNVCTAKNLEYIYSQVRRTEESCNIKHKDFEAFLYESCQLGDESACSKIKKVGYRTQQVNLMNQGIELHGREQLLQRFTGIINKMSNTKKANSGRMIASTEDGLIDDCQNVFKIFNGGVKTWQQENPVVRKRPIRAR